MWIKTEQGWRPLHRVCVNSNNVEGAFIDRTIEEVRQMIAEDEYWKVWDDYRFGIIDFQTWKNHPIHSRKPYSPFVKHSRLRSIR